VANGPAAETNDNDITTSAPDPTYSTTSPWAAAPVIAPPTGPLTLLLDASGRSVSGGNTGATITDTIGSNTIVSGAVGITLLGSAATYETVTTQAGSTNTLTLGGKETVFSGGTDTISLDGNYSSVTATGKATITATANCYNTYVLNGVETLIDSGAGSVTVGASAQVVLDQIATYISVNKLSGGALSINPGQPGLASASFAGGAVSLQVNPTNITGGGSATDSTADIVTFGPGATSFTDGLGADSYVFTNGQVARASIGGFRVGTDSIVFKGFAANPVQSWGYGGGNTVGVLTDGTTITFYGVNVPQPAFVSQTPPPSPPSSVFLTTSGNTVTGGAAALTVTDKIGGNTIVGGSGGLTLYTAGADQVSTAAGAVDTLALAGGSTVVSSGSDKITLSGRGNTIRGGAGLLTVTDTGGGNTITGGSGGLNATMTGSGDTITTAAGSSGAISISGGAVLTSAGNDTITISGTSANVTASGGSIITGAVGSYAAYTLNGGETFNSAGGGLVSIGATGTVTINETAGSLTILKAAGGQVTVNDLVPTTGTVSATVTGGAANITTGKQGVQVVTNGTAPDTIAAGAGPLTVVSRGADTILGGAGNVTVLVPSNTTAPLTFIGGSGDAFISAAARPLKVQGGTGALTVSFGTGTAYVQGGTKADTYSFVAGHEGGTDIITGYRAGVDQLSFTGYTGSAIASQAVSNGSLNIVLTDNTHVTLVGVTHL
jgi:hypothetical protein